MSSLLVNESDVSQLTGMGFSESDARDALRITGGNLELAVNQLLSGIGSQASADAVASATSAVASVDTTTAHNINAIQGSTSQYTYADVGRSACTCIALTAASMFLSSNNDNNGQDVSISPEFLDCMITRGIETYQQIVSCNNVVGVEHMSAEEVLQQQPNLLAVEISPMGVRQGVLSHNRDHPLGLQALLQGILLESQGGSSSGEWICVVMTKTPETVLLCLPTTSDTLPSSSSSLFWLIDSHPRPQLARHNLMNAYALSCPSLDALLHTLYQIFPTTDLGQDIPEMMAEMYNSFDLYPIQRRSAG
jgi:UBA/TS-N domain